MLAAKVPAGGSQQSYTIDISGVSLGLAQSCFWPLSVFSLVSFWFLALRCSGARDEGAGLAPCDAGFVCCLPRRCLSGAEGGSHKPRKESSQQAGSLTVSSKQQLLITGCQEPATAQGLHRVTSSKLVIIVIMTVDTCTVSFSQSLQHMTA